MSKKKKKNLDSQSKAINRKSNAPVPKEAAGEEKCPLEAQIKIFPKLDAEYKVVLLEPKLCDHQHPSEDKIIADPTAIEIWLEQDKPSPVYDEGARISITGPGAIECFADEAMTVALDSSDVVPPEKITGGSKLKLWVSGKTVGKLTL